MSHPRIIKDGDSIRLDTGDEQHELENNGPSASVHRIQSRQQVPQIRPAHSVASSSKATTTPAATGAMPQQAPVKRVHARQAAIANSNPSTSMPAAKVGQSSAKPPSKFKQQMQANKADGSATAPSPVSVLKGGIKERAFAAPVKQIVATTPAIISPLNTQPKPLPVVRPPATPSTAIPNALQAKALPPRTSERKPTNTTLASEFDDVSQIRENNMQQILQMSDAEMKEAMDSITSLLSPQMLEFLRTRAPSSEVTTAMQGHSEPKPAAPAEPVDLSSIQTEEDLRRAAASLPAAEKQKLAWTGMFEASEKQTQQNSVAADTSISKALRSERFDLHGKLLGVNAAGTEEDSELFHHESKPDTPGYTLVELCELARSQVPSQRIIALRAIQGALRARAKAVLPESYGNFSSELAASELPVELPAAILYSFGERVAPQVVTEALAALSALVQCTSEDVEFDSLNTRLQLFASAARAPFIPNTQMSRKHKNEGRQAYEQAELFAIQRVKELVTQANEPQDSEGVADTPPIHELLGLLSRHHLVEGIVFSGFLNVLPGILSSTPLGMPADSALPARAATAALAVMRAIARSSDIHAEYIVKNVVLVVLKKSKQFFDLLSPSSLDIELKLPILQLFEAAVQSSRAAAMLLANKGLLEILPAIILHTSQAEAGVQLAGVKLLRSLLVYGVGLPTVADLVELLKSTAGEPVGHANSEASKLLRRLGFDTKLAGNHVATLELLQMLEHAIPVLAHALAKLMDGNQRPGVAHKPVTFAVGDIRFHESVLQRLAGHVLSVATELCEWVGPQLQTEHCHDEPLMRSVLNLVATIHASTSAVVDSSTTGSFIRIADMYATRFLRDGDLGSAIQRFVDGWETLKPQLASWMPTQLSMDDSTPATLAGAFLVARLLPIVCRTTFPEAVPQNELDLRQQLSQRVEREFEEAQPILTKLGEGVQTLVLRRLRRTTVVYNVLYLLRFGELSADQQLQFAFKLLRILGPGDEAFAVKIIEDICFGEPLQSRLGSVSRQELIHLRSLYSVAICDQDTLLHSQAIALRLCFQVTSQRCCPPETCDASMLPLPPHWLLLPLAGSGTNAQITSKVVVNVLKLLVMMQQARFQCFLELPVAAVIYSVMCAALALQEAEVSWTLEAHGMNEVTLSEEAETATTELMQQILVHQLAGLFEQNLSSEAFMQEFRGYIQQDSNTGKRSAGITPAGRRSAPVNTVLDFVDELLARVLSGGAGGSEMLPTVSGLLLLPQMHWTVQERTLLEIGKAGQLDLVTSSVLDTCVGAWLKPSRPLPAVDAILDAISAGFAIGPARITLIQNTALYAVCLHAVAQAIDASADPSSQKQVWYRLSRLGNVDFATDAVAYSTTTFKEARRVLQEDDLRSASDAVKRVWEEQGWLPYAQREGTARAEAQQLIESNCR